ETVLGGAFAPAAHAGLPCPVLACEPLAAAVLVADAGAASCVFAAGSDDDADPPHAATRAQATVTAAAAARRDRRTRRVSQGARQVGITTRSTASRGVRPGPDHSVHRFPGSLAEVLTNSVRIGEGRAVCQLRTGSLESLRERNRLRVVEALRQRGAISRSDVARATGLSRSTVSSLVADLQAEGLVVEREVASTPRGPEGGRPPVLIALDQSAGALLGIDFGHRHVRVAVADLSFTVLAERLVEIDVDTAGNEALDLAAGLAEQLLDDAGVERSRTLAAGMGLPGRIDR